MFCYVTHINQSRHVNTTVPCKQTQQVTTLLALTMLGPFAWALSYITLVANVININKLYNVNFNVLSPFSG